MPVRFIAVSAICLGLAACGTDKIAMSSEVGGGNTSRVVGGGGSGNGGGAGNGGNGGVPGIPGGGAGGGIGVTGPGGVLDNVVGLDPVGGIVDTVLGPNNPVSDLLGGGAGGGLIPSVAAGLAGDPSAEIPGLGILGAGGVVADLAGSDLLGALNIGGVVGASIAGGNDGLLGTLLNGQANNPPLAPVAGLVPGDVVSGALDKLPALGIAGSGSLVADLTGVDLVGNLVGGNAPLVGGGNSGLLGNIVPAGNAPLAPVGDAVTGVLNVVAGNQPSPVAGVTGQLAGLPVLDTILGSGAGIPGGSPVAGALAPVTGALAPVTGAVSNVPVVGGVVGSVLPPANAPSTPPAAAPNGPLAPVTNVVSNLPVVGGLLGGLGGLGRR